MSKKVPNETLLLLVMMLSPLYSAGKIQLNCRLNFICSVWLEENITTTCTASLPARGHLSQVGPQPYPQTWHTTYTFISSGMTTSLLLSPRIFPTPLLFLSQRWFLISLKTDTSGRELSHLSSAIPPKPLLVCSLHSSLSQ